MSDNPYTVIVRAPRDGYRRGGQAWTATPTAIVGLDLAAAEALANPLQADPAMVVQIVEEIPTEPPSEPPKKPAAEPEPPSEPPKKPATKSRPG